MCLIFEHLRRVARSLITLPDVVVMFSYGVYKNIRVQLPLMRKTTVVIAKIMQQFTIISKIEDFGKKGQKQLRSLLVIEVLNLGFT